MADEEKKGVKNTSEDTTPKTSKKKEKSEEKLFTQAEMNEVIQQRLARKEKEVEEQIKEVQAEAERLAQLSAEEKEKELVEKTRKENEERERRISIRENKLDAIDMFRESKVPENLVDYVINEDKERTLENAKAFTELYNESVSKTVEEKLKGTPPKDLSTNSNKQPESKVVTTF